MSLDRLTTSLDIKTVSEQRIISGHAAAWTLDRVGDVIDQKAFNKTLSEKAPSDVAVFIGHNSAALPVGIPLVIRPDEKGLYTEVRVFDGPAGDNLLAVARGLKAHGQTLGLSIGYRVRDSKMERTAGQGMVRRLLDIDLVEFSYAARQSIANPQALMTGVKAIEGSKAAVGSFGYAVQQVQAALRESQQRYCAIVDLFPDRVIYRCYSDGETEQLYEASYSMAADGEVALGTPEARDVRYVPMPSKTDDAPLASSDTKTEVSPVNPDTLPDSAFLFIEEGGSLDHESKTVPRAKRHLAYRDAAGTLDLATLRQVIAEIPATQAEGLTAETKTIFQTRLRRMADQIVAGKTADDASPEWQQGAAVSVLALGYRLIDASETIATELKAMSLLGSDTKQNGRLRAELRQKLADLAGDLSRLIRQAELIDAEQDGAAQMALNRSRLQLLEV